MEVASAIRRFVNALPDNQLFSTRDLLSFGTRTAVDNNLSRMVKNQQIFRVARGLFIKCIIALEKLSLVDIARAKAAAFGKNIATRGTEALCLLRLRCIGGGDADAFGLEGGAANFCVSGSSSEFMTVKGLVRLWQTSARKMKFLDGKDGLVIRGLWSLGKDYTEDWTQIIRIAISNLDHNQYRLLRLSVSLMPDWLARQFLWYREQIWRGFPGVHCLVDGELVSNIQLAFSRGIFTPELRACSLHGFDCDRRERL